MLGLAYHFKVDAYKMLSGNTSRGQVYFEISSIYYKF